MLKKLLRKELVLSMHPTVPLMLLLCVMVLIPNYPYTVVFFYSTLSLFFTCLLGRENNDVVYTVGLPVDKRDAVKARMLFAALFQLLQLVLVAVLCAVRRRLGLPANEIVIPIIMMCYVSGGSLVGCASLPELKNLLVSNGWNAVTAINTVIFTVFHWPCSTTLLTVKKETGKARCAIAAALIPTVIGTVLCIAVNLVSHIFA